MMRPAALLLALVAGAARAGPAAITSQNAEALTLIETEGPTVIWTVPLPGKPAAVAMDAARGRIMAIAVETGRLHVFDLTGKALADWSVTGAPFGLAIRPGSGTALVTDQAGRIVREIDPATGAITNHWPTGLLPSGVAEAEGMIVVANRDSDSVMLIGAEKSRTVAVGHHPFGVTLYLGRAFVTDVLSDQVSVIDLASGEVIATIPTGARPYAVAFAAGRGFVTNQYDSSLTVFDAATLKVVGHIKTDDYPEGIAATPEGTLVVANWFSDTVQIIDPDRMEVIGSLDMPEGPRAFGQFTAAP